MRSFDTTGTKRGALGFVHEFTSIGTVHIAATGFGWALTGGKRNEAVELLLPTIPWTRH